MVINRNSILCSLEKLCTAVPVHDIWPVGEPIFLKTPSWQCITLSLYWRYSSLGLYPMFFFLRNMCISSNDGRLASALFQHSIRRSKVSLGQLLGRWRYITRPSSWQWWTQFSMTSSSRRSWNGCSMADIKISQRVTANDQTSLLDVNFP